MLTFNPDRRQLTVKTAGIIVDLLITPAQAMHATGDLDGAEYAYRALHDSYPDHPKPIHELGVLLVQRGKIYEGVPLLIKAVRLNMREAAWHHDLGCALADHYKELDLPLTEVIRHFETAVMLDRHHLYAHANLGQIYETQGDIDKALMLFKFCEVLDPENDHWPLRQAHLLLQTGRGDEAQAIVSGWQERHGHSAVLSHHLQAMQGQSPPARASDDYVTQVFDNLASTFDSHLAMLEYQAPRWVGEAMVRRLGAAASGLAVLDAGCGTGLCAPHVRPLAGRLVGVDLSSGMLDRARLRGQYDELKTAELVNYAEMHPGEFDAVLCADTLCYFGDLSAALQAFHSALRPGGTLVFTVEQQEGDGTCYALCTHGRYQHPRGYIDSVLQAGGWRDIEVSSVHLRNENRQPVTGWLVSASK